MTLRLIIRRAIVPFVLALAGFPAAAQILGTSARQTSSGSLKFLAYYQGVAEQTLNFSVVGAGTCSAGAPGVTFACGQGAEVEAMGSGGAGLMKVAWQAAERFQPYLTLGGGGYRMAVPSTTVTNSLTGDPGLIFGGGVKASVVPDTQFGPGIALDLGVMRSFYKFNRISRGGNVSDINERLTLMTYQLAVEASHLFSLDRGWTLEPYGGIKWVRVDADLKDLSSGSRAGGTQDTASPFVGLRVPFKERNSFFVESAFVDGYHYGAGLEFRFQ